MEEEKKNEFIVPTKFSRLRNMVKSVEKELGGDGIDLDDLDISFEFIVGSLFPQAYQSMLDSLKDEHTLGYIEGYAAGKETKLNINQ